MIYLGAIFIPILIFYYLNKKPKIEVGKPYIYTGNTFAKENNWKPTYQSKSEPDKKITLYELMHHTREKLNEDYTQSIRKVQQGKLVDR